MQRFTVPKNQRQKRRNTLNGSRRRSGLLIFSSHTPSPALHPKMLQFSSNTVIDRAVSGKCDRNQFSQGNENILWLDFLQGFGVRSSDTKPYATVHKGENTYVESFCIWHSLYGQGGVLSQQSAQICAISTQASSTSSAAKGCSESAPRRQRLSCLWQMEAFYLKTLGPQCLFRRQHDRA